MNKNRVRMTLLIAGPGAGKTRRLTGDVKALLSQSVSPFSIKPITFAREAAMEITQRLDGDVAAQTNHSFGLTIIGTACKARGETIPRIIDDERQKALVQRALQETGKTKLDVSDIMTQMAKVRERGTPLARLEPAIVSVINRYYQIMSAEGLMDFSGILERARKELENPDIQEFLAGQYIFADEGQDTNPYNEWPILQKLYEECMGFTMFASPSQQIYGFRGADWEQLVKSFPEDHVEESMLINHRSTPQIVKASVALAGKDADGMIPVNKDGPPVLWVDAVNPDMELDYIAAQVAKWITSQAVEKPSDIAILTRVHNQLFPIERILRARGIPTTLMSQKHNPFTRVETRALLGYLKLAADPMDDTMLEDIIDYPSCGIGSRRRYQLRRDEDLTWDHMAMALAFPDDHPEQVIGRIHQLLDVRADLDELNKCNLPVHERVAKAIDMTGISVQLLADGDYNGVRALEDLTKASKEFRSLDEFAEYLSDELDKPRETDGVVLGTLHASKGREWPAVIMPNMQNGALPMAGGDKVEEQNLAFVGVSRPKQRLVLVSNAASAPSPFVTLAKQEAIKWPRKR